MLPELPKVLISYSHDSPEHAQHVLELANHLRADGIDCIIDQYVVAPAEGWPRWMDKQIRDSDFVVMGIFQQRYVKHHGIIATNTVLLPATQLPDIRESFARLSWQMR